MTEDTDAAAAHAVLADTLASALSAEAPKNAGSQRAAASLGSRLANSAMEMALADETRDAAERYAASLWRQGGLTRRGSGTDIAIASVEAALNLDDDSLALLEPRQRLDGASTARHRPLQRCLSTLADSTFTAADYQ